MTVREITARPLARRHPRQRTFLLRLAPAVLIVLIWALVSAQIHKALILPSPTATFTAFVDRVTSGDIFIAWGHSLVTMLLGLLIAAAIGVGLGTWFGLVPTADRLLSPLVRLAFVVPTIALLPLIIIWFGLGFTAKLVIIVYSSFYEIVTYTDLGTKQAIADYREVGMSLRTNRFQFIRSIVLPGSVPYIVTGLRLAVGQAVVAVILAEFFTAVSGPLDGIGAFIRSSGQRFNMADMLSGVASLGLVAVILLYVMRRLERAVAPWHAASASQDS